MKFKELSVMCMCVYLQGVCCHSWRKVARDVHNFEEHTTQTSGGDAETGENGITTLLSHWKFGFIVFINFFGLVLGSIQGLKVKVVDSLFFKNIHSVLLCKSLIRITNTLGAICEKQSNKHQPSVTVTKQYQMLSKQFNSSRVTLRLYASNHLRFNTRWRQG